MSGKEILDKVKKYRDLTERALAKVKKINGLNEIQEKIADDFLSMARNYFSDAKYFEEKGDFLTALSAYSYAHAWLDAGIRSKLFDGEKDDKLFTLP
ncbi:MAG: DUF357 domain-containing protein [Candidatus Diapherotrites archaeon]